MILTPYRGYHTNTCSHSVSTPYGLRIGMEDHVYGVYLALGYNGSLSPIVDTLGQGMVGRLWIQRYDMGEVIGAILDLEYSLPLGTVLVPSWYV